MDISKELLEACKRKYSFIFAVVASEFVCNIFVNCLAYWFFPPNNTILPKASINMIFMDDWLIVSFSKKTTKKTSLV